MLCEVTTPSGLILPTGDSNWARNLPTVRDLVSDKVCPHTPCSMTQKLGSSPLSSGLSQNQNHPICSSNQCFQRGAWGDDKDWLCTHSLSSIPSLLDCSRRESCQKNTHTTLLFVSEKQAPGELCQRGAEDHKIIPARLWVMGQPTKTERSTVLGKGCL